MVCGSGLSFDRREGIRGLYGRVDLDSARLRQ